MSTVKDMRPTSADDTEVDDPDLRKLYQDFEAEHLNPLWTQIGGLMPMTPQPQAQPHVWDWSRLHALAERAGELVPVGRGGERRAIALANPGLGGVPYVSPTLWAAIQYLGPHEFAPEHRHVQNAFRFVVEGEGVWTVVNGDPVAMHRGDFLPQPGWNWHSHANMDDKPMVWIDGLDIPFVHYADTGFFEFGSDQPSDDSTPDKSRSERLWGHPGLRPLTQLGPAPQTPLLAYRWAHTDQALKEQLALEDEGYSATFEPGHAVVRYTNPATGGDALATMRCEFHRLRSGTTTAARRDVCSTVCHVFEGTGTVVLGDAEHKVTRGDMFVVPSWVRWSIQSEGALDLFAFSDAPIMETLQFSHTQFEGESL